MGRYRVERLLGEGGMGSVYLGAHVDSGQPVAVKLLKSMSDELRLRFEREAKLGGKLSHPNICNTMDFGRSDHGSFLVMEFVEGTPADELLESIAEQGQQLPWRDVCEIGLGMAAGLEHAHQSRVIHRDLKPGNIVLSGGRRERDAVKLLDFGIARSMDPQTLAMTVEGSLIGTLPYMAPEQIGQGVTANVRTDVYSLGATLHALLTTHPPYDAPSFGEFVVKVATQPPDHPLRLVRPDVPPGLAQVIDKAMSREADLRFGSAAEFERALHEALEHGSTRASQAAQPIAAARPSSPASLAPAPHGTASPGPSNAPRASTPLTTGGHPQRTSAAKRSRAPLYAAIVLGALVLAGLTALGIVWFAKQRGSQSANTRTAPSTQSPPTTPSIEIDSTRIAARMVEGPSPAHDPAPDMLPSNDEVDPTPVRQNTAMSSPRMSRTSMSSASMNSASMSSAPRPHAHSPANAGGSASMTEGEATLMSSPSPMDDDPTPRTTHIANGPAIPRLASQAFQTIKGRLNGCMHGAGRVPLRVTWTALSEFRVDTPSRLHRQRLVNCARAVTVINSTITCRRGFPCSMTRQVTF